MSKFLYVERPGAEPIDPDRTYTLTEFSRVVAARYGIGFHNLRLTLNRHITESEKAIPGVLIDTSMKARRIYLTPVFTRKFINRVVPKIQCGLSLRLALSL